MTTLPDKILNVCGEVGHHSLLGKWKLRPPLYTSTHPTGQLQSNMIMPSAEKVTEQLDTHTLLVAM